jgi:hypothetical protein
MFMEDFNSEFVGKKENEKLRKANTGGWLPKAPGGVIALGPTMSRRNHRVKFTAVNPAMLRAIDT